MQWVNTAYLLSIAMVIPVTGRLAERFGTRAMWLFALTAFTAGSALCGTAWSVGSLIAFRAAQGIGGGMIVPLGALLLIPLYHQQVRGHDALTAGLLLVPQSLGTMLALPYAGRLTDRIGARPVVLAGIAASTLGALAYTQTTGAPVLAAALFVWGIGIAAVAVPVAAAAYQGLPPAMIPSATSAITMVQTAGASVGAAVLTAILQSRGGPLDAAFADTFWWVVGFTAVALVPALFLPMSPARK